MTLLNGKQMFPCPVCTDPREVRQTKKGKPYLVCDPCGIQIFIRGPAGVTAFNRLADQADGEDLHRSSRVFADFIPEAPTPNISNFLIARRLCSGVGGHSAWSFGSGNGQRVP